MTDPIRSVFRIFTIERVLLVGLLVMNVARWQVSTETSVVALDRRLAIVESTFARHVDASDATFVRRDVIQERLRAIEQQLVQIREQLDDGR